VLGVHLVRNKLNRTIEDSGTLVDGNEVYIYGNPGEGRAVPGDISGATTPFNIPKAKRVYDAVDITWDRRLNNRWFLSANYTYSRTGTTHRAHRRLRADWAVGVNQPTSGNTARAGGNESRAFGLDETMFDAHSNIGVYGLLPTDRKCREALGFAPKRRLARLSGLFNAERRALRRLSDQQRNQPACQWPWRHGRSPALFQTDILVAHEFQWVERVQFSRIERAQRLQPEDDTHLSVANAASPVGFAYQPVEGGDLLNGYDCCSDEDHA
jgi:hypothetical protein